MSRRTSPIAVDGAASEASESQSATPAPSIFGRMMAGPNAKGSSAPAALTTTLRDLCQRPPPIYNEFYDPHKPENDNLPSKYSPFVHGQPLFDDREVNLRKLPSGKTLAPAIKKPQRSWTWELGYRLIDLAHPKKHQYWACKRCKLRES